MKVRQKKSAMCLLLKISWWITISMESSRRDLFIDMVVDRYIFKNTLITLVTCFIFMPKTDVGLQRLIFTVKVWSNSQGGTQEIENIPLKTYTVKTKRPFQGVLYLFGVWNWDGVNMWLFFKIDLCSATSFERSRRALPMDVAEHRSILKNNHIFTPFQFHTPNRYRTPWNGSFIFTVHSAQILYFVSFDEA